MSDAANSQVLQRVIARAALARSRWLIAGGAQTHRPTVRVTRDEMNTLPAGFPLYCGLPIAIDAEPHGECPECGGRSTLAEILRAGGTSTLIAMCPHCRVGSPATEWRIAAP